MELQNGLNDPPSLSDVVCVLLACRPSVASALLWCELCKGYITCKYTSSSKVPLPLETWEWGLSVFGDVGKFSIDTPPFWLWSDLTLFRAQHNFAEVNKNLWCHLMRTHSDEIQSSTWRKVARLYCLGQASGDQIECFSNFTSGFTRITCTCVAPVLPATHSNTWTRHCGTCSVPAASSVEFVFHCENFSLSSLTLQFCDCNVIPQRCFRVVNSRDCLKFWNFHIFHLQTRNSAVTYFSGGNGVTGFTRSGICTTERSLGGYTPYIFRAASATVVFVERTFGNHCMNQYKKCSMVRTVINFCRF